MYITMQTSKNIKTYKLQKEWMFGKFYITFWKRYLMYRNDSLQD